MTRKLFQRGTIGNLELKNRVVMPAMGCSFASETGIASDEMIRYYQDRAKGGCALIITEITRVDDETGIGTPCQLSVTKKENIPSLVRLAEAIHAYDSKIFVQLHHPGNQTPSRLLDGKPPVSASDVTCKTIGDKPRALTTEEVEALVRKFVTGAVYCQIAGIDGVEIHAAHGYLINQFMSPHTNKRTDKYGGDFMGRMRFITEIIKGIQMQCGPKFPISVRLNGDDYIEDGIKLEEAVQMAVYLEKLGIQCLNVSCGTYESGYTIIEPQGMPEAWKQHLAKTIKSNVSIPVIAVNNIKHPAIAEKLLQADVCDFIGIARGQLADPEWANKAKAGKEELIRKCLSCMECFRVLNALKPLECTINPVLGRELHFNDDTMKKDGDGRKVAVIGGGPAGMQAAVVLAKRGYKPVIFEKDTKLGGAANLAAIPPHKELMGEFIDTMAEELKELNVEVRLNTPASVEDVAKLNPVGIFLATGGNPIVPQLDGIENAVTSTDVLTKQVEYKDKSIIVVGGGVTGLETAETIGQDNQVTIIEMAKDVGTTLYASAKALLMKRIMEQGTKVMTETTLVSVQKDSVTVKNAQGESQTIPCDAVVLAMGVRSDRSLRDEFEQSFDRVILIGDSEKPGQIREALHAAYDKAFVF